MSHEKRKFHINVVDVIITLVVFLVLAVGGFMIAHAFGVGSGGNKNLKVEMEYVVQFRCVRDEIADNVHVGEIAVDAQKRQQHGIVLASRLDDYMMEFYDYSIHALTSAPCPDYKDVFVTLKSQAVSDEDGNYYVNGVRIAYGEPLAVHLPSFCKVGSVCSVTVREVK